MTGRRLSVAQFLPTLSQPLLLKSPVTGSCPGLRFFAAGHHRSALVASEDWTYNKFCFPLIVARQLNPCHRRNSLSPTDDRFWWRLRLWLISCAGINRSFRLRIANYKRRLCYRRRKGTGPSFRNTALKAKKPAWPRIGPDPALLNAVSSGVQEL